MATDILLPLGSVFADDFRIVRELGRGGMGTVYVAHQLSTARDRALKLMHPLLVADSDLRKRFEQEAKVGSRIRSEHVVEVVAAGVDAATGMPWLAMELLQGEDLSALVNRVGPLSHQRAYELFTQICHALGAAHAAGIVHRDLKPENVFLAQAQREGGSLTVKLLDFGIAKIVSTEAGHTASVGTPLWMAPEQGGGAVGPPADVWALGLLMFWMLTGRSYWLAAASPEGPSILRIMEEIVTTPFARASERANALGCTRSLPAGFDDWFARCVARDPKARFADASQARIVFPPPSSEDRNVDWSAPTLLPGQASTPPAVSRTLPPPNGTTTRKTYARRLGFSISVVVTFAVMVGVVAWRKATVLTSLPSSAMPSAVRSVASPPKPALPESADAAPIDLSPAGAHTVWNVPLGDSPTRGPADALVTIIEFGNYQCPFSKSVEETVQRLLREHPRDIRLIWKDHTLAVHSLSDGAAQVVHELRTRKGEDAFWHAHDVLLAGDGSPNESILLSVGEKLGLPAQEIRSAITERRHRDVIDKDVQLADDYSVRGTPSFFVNGRYIDAMASQDELLAVVDEELRRANALLAQGVDRKDVYARLTAQGHRGVPLQTRRFVLPDAVYAGTGAADPKALIVQFCTFDHFLCQLIAPTMEALLKEHPNDLGMVWIDMPDNDAQSRRLAILGRLAFQLKGKAGFEEVRRRLFRAADEDNGFSTPALLRYAKDLGLDKSVVMQSFADPQIHSELTANVAAAKQAGLTEVPSFLICRAKDFCKSGGYYLNGGQATRAFEKRIRLVLESAEGPLPTLPN